MTHAERCAVAQQCVPPSPFRDSLTALHDEILQAAAAPWGRSDLMALSAVRYCLGRSTYIVGDCVDWLHHQWPRMLPSTRALIARDVDAEFARDDIAREEGHAYNPLGMDMDRRQWERARLLWAPNAQGNRVITHDKA